MTNEHEIDMSFGKTYTSTQQKLTPCVQNTTNTYSEQKQD